MSAPRVFGRQQKFSVARSHTHASLLRTIAERDAMLQRYMYRTAVKRTSGTGATIAIPKSSLPPPTPPKRSTPLRRTNSRKSGAPSSTPPKFYGPSWPLSLPSPWTATAPLPKLFPDDTYPVINFTNGANLCYLASAMQLLLSCADIVHVLQYHATTSTPNDFYKHMHAMMQLAANDHRFQFDVVYDGSGSTHTWTEAIQKIMDTNIDLTSAAQDDAAQFITPFIDFMLEHDIISQYTFGISHYKRFTCTHTPTHARWLAASDNVLLVHDDARYDKQNMSVIITGAFSGVEVVETTAVCGVTLPGTLQNHQQEFYDGSVNNGVKLYPAYLFVQYKRGKFSNDGEKTSSMSPVEIDVQNSEYIAFDTVQYRLLGVTQYLGSTYSGHWVAVCRRQGSNDYYLYDSLQSTAPTKTTLTDCLQAHISMLLYERIDLNSTNPRGPITIPNKVPVPQAVLPSQNAVNVYAAKTTWLSYSSNHAYRLLMDACVSQEDNAKVRAQTYDALVSVSRPSSETDSVRLLYINDFNVVLSWLLCWSLKPTLGSQSSKLMFDITNTRGIPIDHPQYTELWKIPRGVALCKSFRALVLRLQSDDKNFAKKLTATYTKIYKCTNDHAQVSGTFHKPYLRYYEANISGVDKNVCVLATKTIVVSNQTSKQKFCSTCKAVRAMTTTSVTYESFGTDVVIFKRMPSDRKPFRYCTVNGNRFRLNQHICYNAGYIRYEPSKKIYIDDFKLNSTNGLNEYAGNTSKPSLKMHANDLLVYVKQ